MRADLTMAPTGVSRRGFLGVGVAAGGGLLLGLGLGTAAVAAPGAAFQPNA